MSISRQSISAPKYSDRNHEHPCEQGTHEHPCEQGTLDAISGGPGDSGVRPDREPTSDSLSPGGGLMFENYYRHYITLHQNKHCRRLHLLGMVVAASAFVFLLFTPYWWLAV